LSSLEAAEVRGELVEALAQAKRVCPHLHLCLQSGSDHVLARMKRRYRVAGYLERCRRLRAALDLPAFTTDIILGFPGESSADFAATCAVAREVGFSKMHIFSYSPRPGTPAAGLPDAVPASEVAERRQQLLELGRELADRYFHRLIGRCLDVLVEGPDPRRPGNVLGTSCRYAPVSFEGYAPALLARRVPVRALGVEPGIVRACPIPEDIHLPHLPAGRRSNQPFASRVSLPQVPVGPMDTIGSLVVEPNFALTRANVW
jgi:threonylcarbamoyladenosine tRNA methylthiotransferase MtaB